MDKLLGFAPDVDPTTPGAMLDCANIIPFEAGFAGAPNAAETTADALPAEARSAAVMTKLDESRRLFAGTQTKLYELSGNVWIDRSAGGGSYTGSVDSRWSFAQFGDTSLASNLVDNMQQSTAGAFAAVPTAPKAKIIVSASNNFVIAFNTNDAGFGSAPDRWWCCAQSNQNDWVPSVATSANTGRLIATPGGIQAAMPMGDYVIAYKSRGVYVGQYVGGATVWAWPLVPGSNDAGCVGQDALCDIGGVHFMVGPDDFWLFDGSRPTSIGAEVREWFRLNSSEAYRFRTRCTFDRPRRLVWINFPSTSSSGALDRCLVYNVTTKRFGVSHFVCEATLTYTAPGVTIDGLDAYASSIDALPDVPFDSAYWLAGGRAFAHFSSTHKLVLRNAACETSSYLTNDMGTTDVVSLLDGVVVQFHQEPTAATCTGFFKMTSGGAFLAGPTEPIYEGSFDVRQSGRFHRLRFDFVGPHREGAHKAILMPEGGR